jgi:O6-methylguanine-DNA--protein-cysteine methyltransferase
VPGTWRRTRRTHAWVAEAVAAVQRYFEGEETDFSGFELDLGEQGAFFKQIYAAARQVGWGQTTTYGALTKEVGAGRRPPAMSARPWPRIRCR